MIKRIIAILCLLLPLTSWSQNTSSATSFSLFSLSADKKYDTGKLNKEIRRARDLEEVKQIVLKQITSKQGKIIVAFKVNGKFYRWKRVWGQEQQESSKEWIITGTRDIGIPKLLSPRQLPEMLKDTIVVIDSFMIRIEFRERNFPVNQYKLQYNCSTDQKTIDIPVVDLTTLLLSRVPFSSCNKTPFVNAAVYNARAKYQDTCHFAIFMPDVSELDQWRSIFRRLKESFPEETEGSIAAMISAYAKEEYGISNTSYLQDWLLIKK